MLSYRDVAAILAAAEERTDQRLGILIVTVVKVGKTRWEIHRPTGPPLSFLKKRERARRAFEEVARG